METKLSPPELQQLKRFAAKNIRMHGLSGINTALNEAGKHLALQQNLILAKEFQNNFYVRDAFSCIQSNLEPMLKEATGVECIVKCLGHEQHPPRPSINNDIQLFKMTISFEIPFDKGIPREKSNNNNMHNKRKVVPLHAE